PLPPCDRGHPERRTRSCGVAAGREPAAAPLTGAATDLEGDNHAVTGAGDFDSVGHLDDLSDELVAEGEGPGQWRLAGDHRGVEVASGDSDGAHQCVTIPGQTRWCDLLPLQPPRASERELPH